MNYETLPSKWSLLIFGVDKFAGHKVENENFMPQNRSRCEEGDFADENDFINNFQ